MPAPAKCVPASCDALADSLRPPASPTVGNEEREGWKDWRFFLFFQTRMDGGGEQKRVCRSQTSTREHRPACAAAGSSTPLRELPTTPPQILRRALRRTGAWARLQEAPVALGAPAACAACARLLRARRRRRADVPMRATGEGAGQTCPCDLRGRPPGEGAGRQWVAGSAGTILPAQPRPVRPRAVCWCDRRACPREPLSDCDPRPCVSSVDALSAAEAFRHRSYR